MLVEKINTTVPQGSVLVVLGQLNVREKKSLKNII